MKIEKINNSQLKILLTNEDLQKRSIKMAELAFGSKKTRSLFKEVVDLATAEYDFDADDSQLMIEAIPISLESVVVIITKIEEKQDENQEKNKAARYKSVLSNIDEGHMSIFEFNSFEDVTFAARALYGRFIGTSQLLKKNNKYFLFLQSDNKNNSISDTELELIVGEYGKKNIVNVISQAYILEHGELIIGNSAVKVINEYSC